MSGTSTVQEGTRPGIRGYVARVRAALADLPVEDVDDLTQGMEADLEELAAESGSIRSRLGTPETYARELRAAAGMPPRRLPRINAAIDARLVRWGEQRRAFMAMPWMRDALPIVWALRGIVAAWAFVAVLGGNANNLGAWLIGAVLSVWVGRRTLHWTHGRRAILTGINLLAMVIGLLIVLPTQLSRPVSNPGFVQAPMIVDGLANNGEPVTDITVYDPDGRQVERPRIFDQNGNPLLTGADQGTYEPPATLPRLPEVSTTAPSPTADATSPTTPPGTPNTTPGAKPKASTPATSPTTP